MNEPTNIVIVGAGLAGLIAGRRLAEAGYDVTILEATDRCGGKAGCYEDENGVTEHGYHIFPAWYHNTRALLDEAGTTLIDLDHWLYMPPGGGEPIKYTIPSGVREAFASLFNGRMSAVHTALYYYFLIDLLTMKMTRSNKAIRDRVSRVGAARDRWYLANELLALEQENTLKASAIPVYELSAMTAQIISGYWMERSRPLLSILPNDLHSSFIAPLEEAARQAGVRILFGHRVEKVLVSAEDRVEAVTVMGADGQSASWPVGQLLMTTPLEVTRRLFGKEALHADPDLGKFQHLRAEPMAALHLHLRERLDLPKQHMFMLGGKYALSVIDNAHHWPNQSGSRLSVISSDFTPLKDLPEDHAAELLVDELRRYINIPDTIIEHWTLHPNVEAPLFVNTVGAWSNRPKARAKKLTNLWFAGDWVRNPIDLACMEGTVCSAMTTSSEIAQALGGAPLSEPILPKSPPRWLMLLGKWFMTPFILPIALWSRLTHKEG